MQRQIIYFLLVAILVAIFALTNAQVMTVRLFFVSYELSGALVILFSVALGALLVVVLNAANWFKQKRELKNANHEKEKLQLELKNATTQLENAQQEIENLKAEKNQLQQPSHSEQTNQ